MGVQEHHHLLDMIWCISAKRRATSMKGHTTVLRGGWAVFGTGVVLRAGGTVGCRHRAPIRIWYVRYQ